MLRLRHLLALPCIGCALLAGCSHKADKNAPLAYVPADTPYVYANLEPPSKDVTDMWSQHMQEYLPVLLPAYEQALQDLEAGLAKKPDPTTARVIKLARVFLNEIKTHDDRDKLHRIGLKPDALFALYGVGMTPVIRLQLADTAAFKAEIAHIEHEAGETMPVARLGKLSYWHVGNEMFEILMAVQGQQLVVTFAPTQAGDGLRRTLLGLTPPAKSLAQSGTLSELAGQYGYSKYGEGYIDVTRVIAHLTRPMKGTDREIAKLSGLPTGGVDATCQSEYQQIAGKFPRLVAGVKQLSARHIDVAAQMEMDAGLAKKLMNTLGAAPGTDAPGEGIVDVSASLPLLKLKDFWIAQADAVAAKPFACKKLAELNSTFAQLKSRLGITIPPPFSDMTGMRFVLDKVTPHDHGMPEFAGRWLFATSNPKGDLAMAQLTIPALKNFSLTDDGKPVPLPSGLAPRGFPPLFAAMSDKAIALGAGSESQAKLGEFLAAPATDKPVFLRMHFSNGFYKVMADYMRLVATRMPGDLGKRLDAQTKLFSIYEKWFRSGDLTLTTNERGILLEESIDQN